MTSILYQHDILMSTIDFESFRAIRQVFIKKSRFLSFESQKLWAIWELGLLFRWLSWDISATTHTILFFRWRFGTAWPLAFIYGVGKLNRITRCEVILTKLARQIAYIGYLARMNQRWRPPLRLDSILNIVEFREITLNYHPPPYWRTAGVEEFELGSKFGRKPGI